MIAKLTDARAFIQDVLGTAEEAAEGIFKFSEGAIKKGRAVSLASIPRFDRLQVGGGKQVWAATLFTDLRNSSNRANDVGAYGTYISMHCLLGGLAYLVGEAGGCLANFRGDGLFGLFGLDDDGDNPKDLDEPRAVQRALHCGMAMIELVDEVVNPLLRDRSIPGDLRIGVGVDHGKVVITRIGLRSANEVTAYGPPVNHAAKFCGGNGEIYTSQRTKDVFPITKGGQIGFDHVTVELGKSKRLSGYKARYPKTLRMLARSDSPAKATRFR